MAAISVALAVPGSGSAYVSRTTTMGAIMSRRSTFIIIVLPMTDMALIRSIIGFFTVVTPASFSLSFSYIFSGDALGAMTCFSPIMPTVYKSLDL